MKEIQETPLSVYTYQEEPFEPAVKLISALELYKATESARKKTAFMRWCVKTFVEEYAVGVHYFRQKNTDDYLLTVELVYKILYFMQVDFPVLKSFLEKLVKEEDADFDAQTVDLEEYVPTQQVLDLIVEVDMLNERIKKLEIEAKHKNADLQALVKKINK